MRSPPAWALAALSAVLVVSGCAGHNDPTRSRAQAGIEYANGLQLDLYRPIRGFAPLPAVILVHGGGFADGARDDMADMAEALAYRGYVTATIDYHLSQGTWFPATALTDPGLIAAAALSRQDAQAAVDWLRANSGTYRVDPNRIAVAGYSAGGITAIEVASHPPASVWAAIAISGAGIDLAALGTPHPPLLLVHGDNDDVIPPELADGTCQAATPGGECTVQRIGDIGHDLLTSIKFHEVVADIDTFLVSLNPR